MHVFRYPRVFTWCRWGLLAFCLLLVSSCGSGGRYRITLKDGRIFEGQGEPQFVRKTGYYRYRNFHGRDALIRAEEVLLVEELGR